jgi:hypothetical protein
MLRPLLASTNYRSCRATAPVAGDRWLLIEHPGPWPLCGLPPGLPHELDQLISSAISLGVRIQLIRLPLDRGVSPPHHVYVASSRGSESEVWIEERELTDLRLLRDFNLDQLASGRRPSWGNSRIEPLLLVCTHGERYPCCAQLGRPTAVALVELGSNCWESSHLGGDRFAPNVVCLPDGIYYGGVLPEAAGEIAAACRRREISLPYYRGRAGWPAVVQAAEAFARQETGEIRIHQLRPIGYQTVGRETTVDLALKNRRLQVVIVETRAGRSRPTPCCPANALKPAEYDLICIKSRKGELSGQA